MVKNIPQAELIKAAHDNAVAFVAESSGLEMFLEWEGRVVAAIGQDVANNALMTLTSRAYVWFVDRVHRNSEAMGGDQTKVEEIRQELLEEIRKNQAYKGRSHAVDPNGYTPSV